MVITHNVPAFRYPERYTRRSSGIWEKRLVAACAGDEFPKVEFCLFWLFIRGRHDAVRKSAAMAKQWKNTWAFWSELSTFNAEDAIETRAADRVRVQTHP